MWRHLFSIGVFQCLYFRTSIKGLFIFLFHIVMVTDKQVLVVNHSSYRGKKKGREGEEKAYCLWLQAKANSLVLDFSVSGSGSRRRSLPTPSFSFSHLYPFSGSSVLCDPGHSDASRQNCPRGSDLSAAEQAVPPAFSQICASSGHSLVSSIVPYHKEYSEFLKGRNIPYLVNNSAIGLNNLQLTVTC